MGWQNMFSGMSKSTNYNFGLLKLGGSCLCSILVCPSAIAALAPNSLPDSNPATPENLSSCQNLAFGSFVPDRAPYLTTSSGAKRYSTDTVWTATAADGTTATLRTVRVNDNNISNFITTGNNANIFFVDFEDSQTGFNSPKVVIEEGEPNDGSGDSWDLELEYSSPIGNARLLIGDIDSLITSVAQFKDIVSVEGFLGSSSVVSSNSYAGSILKKTSQGNIVTFQSLDDAGPNPKEDKVANRAVVDYEDAYIDKLQVRYGVGSSLAGVGTQGAFVTSGMSAGCNLSGNVFEDSNGNDLLDTSEPLLDNITVSAYLDDGDGVFEADGSDLLVETQDTTTGAYEFTNLAENEAYWVMVDESDSDLSGYQYHGGNVNLSQINPRLISLTSENVSDVNFPFAIASNNTSPTVSCPANFELVSFNWSPDSDPQKGLVWSDPTTNFYNINGNLVTATFNNRGSSSSLQNGSLFTGAFPPPGSGLTWLMDTPSNDNTQNANFTITFASPVPVSQFLIADVDAKTGDNPTNWHDQLKVSASNSGSPVSVLLTPKDSSIITVTPSGDTAYAADGVSTVNNGSPNANLTTTINGFVDTITIEYQDGPRVRADPAQHGIGVGSFSACYPRLDLGDAPDTDPGTGEGNYQTLTIDNGASHQIVSGIQLGATVDSDNGNLQNSDATADDVDDSNNNDDDGVTVASSSLQSQSLSAGNSVTLDIATKGNGVLNAWIDWNGDGDFTDDDEQIATNVAEGGTRDSDNATAGIQFNVTVPNNATVGNTFARFRYSTDTNLTPTGMASNGEVEDYQIAIAPAPLCPAAKADLWFANDESGSVDSAEFNNALDFIYQISDGFVYDDSTGMKAGITGWTDLVNSTEIVIPITESFGDPGDSGLFSTGNITLNSNSQGIRELYSSKQNSSPGTRLDRATNYLADLITAGNGKRPNTPQVAVILTDASSNFINNTNEGGFFAWIAEANLLRSTEAEIVLILIDEAATAYNSGGFSKFIIDNVVGDNGRVITVPNYADAADSTLGYVNTVSQAICDLSTPVASDPGLLLVKRITAINPDRSGEVQFNDFVDDPNTTNDNHPRWPDSDEDPSSNSNSYLRGVLDGGRIKPGEEVEYTIYFLSQGDEAAEQVNICDAVPDHLTFVKDAYGSEVGIALGYDPDMVRTAPNKFLSNLLNDDAGDFYGANTAPPANLCKKIDSDDNLVIVDGENNDNGAIIVRPAASLEPDTSSGQPPTSLPSAISPGQPAGSYGFIRFRGRVK